MFPITEKYLDHIHTRNGNPVPVKFSLAQEVRSNMQQLRQLINRGRQVVFPDIRRLEKLMLTELITEKSPENPEKKSEVSQQKTSVRAKLNELKQERANKQIDIRKPKDRSER